MGESRPPAVVIGLDCITGLQTARVLARRGVRVVGVAADPAHYCCRTKACEQVIRADTDSADLLEALTGARCAHLHGGVLFPCTDTSMLTIAQHQQDLGAFYRFVLPDIAVVEMLCDKMLFHEFAQTAGLHVPQTRAIDSRADAEAASAEFPYPCVLKPARRSAAWNQSTREKLFVANCPEEFMAHYDRCHEWADELLAQEWIAGTDADIYTCNTYFGANSRPLVTFVSRKIRQWPPESGSGSLCEAYPDDTVRQATVRLLEAARLRGFGELELKRDARSGRLVAIETNVGRPTAISAIAEAGGVDLHYLAYCDAIGATPPPNTGQGSEHVKWWYIRQDLRSALFYMRRGDLTLGGWLRSLRGRKTDAVLDWHDMGPFWADLRSAVGAVVTRERKQAGPPPAHLSRDG